MRNARQFKWSGIVALAVVVAIVLTMQGWSSPESGGTTGGVPVSISVDQGIIFGGESAIGWVELDGENFTGEEFQLGYDAGGLNQDDVMIGRQIEGYSSTAIPSGDNYLVPFIVRAAHNKNCTVKIGVSTAHGAIDPLAPITAPKQPAPIVFKRWPGNPLGNDDIPTDVTASITDDECTITVDVDRSSETVPLEVYLVYPYGAHLLGDDRPTVLTFAPGTTQQSAQFTVSGTRSGRAIVMAVANAVPKVTELTVP